MSQIPLIGGSAYFQGRFSLDTIAQFHARFHTDRAKRAAGHPPEVVPIVTPDDPLRRDAYEWYTQAAAASAPSWQNAVTLRSVEYTAGYEPGTYTSLNSSAPLLLIVAENDVLPLSIAEAAYARACVPEQFVVLPCRHWDVYTTMFDQSTTSACDWFCAHLQKP